MPFDLARDVRFWEDPDEYVLVQSQDPRSGDEDYLITHRWSGAITNMEFDVERANAIHERMIVAGVEVISTEESRRRQRVSQWKSDDPQHVVAARPRDAQHVRLSDGRFQRVVAGPNRQLYCGHDHILAGPALTEVLRGAAGQTVKLTPALLFDPQTRKNITDYTEIVPSLELTPKAIFRAKIPASEVWHSRKCHVFVSPRLKAELEAQDVPELTYYNGFDAIHRTGEFHR